jgi:flagellar export protein FliJ
MRRFRFRLERVLGERRRRERAARLEVAATATALAAAGLRRSALAARRRALAFALAPGSECAVAEILLVEGERCEIERRLGAVRGEIEWLEAALAERRRGLAGARRRVKVLERLRERAMDDYRRARRRAEAKELDDHTGASYRPADRAAASPGMAQGERLCG